MKEAVPIIAVLLMLVSLPSRGQLPELERPEVLPASPEASKLERPEVLPASPEASKLAAYISYPGSLANGLVQTSIPLYEIVDGDIRIPITLSYHASGLKANMRSGHWLGDGWSLTTGPSLSRTINGVADEINYDASIALSDSPTYQQLEAISTQAADAALDEFRYSLPGGGGRLYLRRGTDGAVTPVTIPRDNIAVTPPPGGSMREFRITDGKGVRYTFGGPERRYCDMAMHTYGSSSMEVPTSWKIREIRSGTTGRRVTFDYSTNIPEVFCCRYSDALVIVDQFSGQQTRTIPAVLSSKGAAVSDYYLYDDTDRCLETVPRESLNLPSGYTFPVSSRSDITQYNSYVHRIDFSGGHVLFNMSSDASEGLESVEVYDLSGNLVKRIEFSQTYTADTFSLRLDSVSIESPDGSQTETYSFAYRGSSPPRDTRSIDRWGYYNGRPNATLVPTVTTAVTVNRYPDIGEVVTVTVPGGNREPDGEAMQSGVLTSVTYPTGGCTEFSYEAHRYADDDGTVRLAGGLRIRQIRDIGADGSVLYRNFSYSTDEDGVNGCGRLASEKRPGTATVLYRYDRGAVPVYTQDGGMRVRGEWRFSFRDAHGRDAVSGIWHPSYDPVSFETAAVATYTGTQSPLGGYSLNVAVPQDARLLSVSYYDGYSFIGDLTPAETRGILSADSPDGYDAPDTGTGRAKGLLTGTAVYTVPDTEAGSAADSLTATVSSFYYDRRGRAVQSHHAEALGGSRHVHRSLTFTGREARTRETVFLPDGRADSLVTEVSYDSQERPVNETAALGGRVQSLAYSYDAVGRMTGRTRGAGSGRPGLAETLSYNVRDQLTGLSSDVFGMTLRYHDPALGSTPRYNGAVSEWEWRWGDGTGADANAWSLTYDAAGRLTDAKRFSGGVSTDAYGERALSYDRNGNILSLTRYGADATSPAEVLAYSYNGNLLSSISNSGSSGGGGSFTHDANGNLTHDGLSGIDISYDALNMTRRIASGGTTLAEYVRLADGTKLCAVDGNGNGYQYRGSLIYSQTANQSGAVSLALDCALTSGGRIVRVNGADSAGGTASFRVLHYLRDHLGSVRAIVDGDSGEVIEANDYYPFGKRIAIAADPEHDEESPSAAVPTAASAGSATAQSMASSNRWLFSGKESQSFLSPDIPLLDFGARMYDPITARWTTADPMADKYYGISQYGYCLGNPISIIDPNGMEVKLGELTKQNHQIAMERFMATKTGKRFLLRFMSEGETVTVGSSSIAAIKNGDRHKDEFWVYSAHFPDKSIRGQSQIQIRTSSGQSLKVNSNKLSKSDFTSAEEHIVQVMYLNEDMSADESTAVMGHEAFVHIDVNSDSITKWEKGETNNRSLYYILTSSQTNADSDHKSLADGECKVYKDYMNELYLLLLNDYFLKYYKEDVKRHK